MNTCLVWLSSSGIGGGTFYTVYLVRLRKQGNWGFLEREKYPCKYFYIKVGNVLWIYIKTSQGSQLPLQTFSEMLKIGSWNEWNILLNSENVKLKLIAKWLVKHKCSVKLHCLLPTVQSLATHALIKIWSPPRFSAPRNSFQNYFSIPSMD